MIAFGQRRKHQTCNGLIPASSLTHTRHRTDISISYPSSLFEAKSGGGVSSSTTAATDPKPGIAEGETLPCLLACCI